MAAPVRCARAISRPAPARRPRSSAREPVRGIVGQGIRFGEDRLPLPGDPAQHRVDDTLKSGSPLVGLREAHGEIDGGVVRHGEVEDLRAGRGEHGHEARLAHREPPVEPRLQHPPNLAEAAEGRHGDRPGKGRIPGSSRSARSAPAIASSRAGGRSWPISSATTRAATRRDPSPATSCAPSSPAALRTLP